MHGISSQHVVINPSSSLFNSITAPTGFPVVALDGLTVDNALNAQSNGQTRQTMDDNLNGSTAPGLPTEFDNHAVNKVSGVSKIFDPSYGGMAYANEQIYEDSTFSGFLRVYLNTTGDDFRIIRISNSTGLDTTWHAY